MARLTEAELMVLRRLIEEEPAGQHMPGGYPMPRGEEEYVHAQITARYARYEATPGYVTLGDTYAQVIEFSGCPDSIEIFCLDNPLLLQFLNQTGGSNEPIQLEAGNFYEPGLVYKQVIARNLNVGFNARIQVVGKWVSR